MTIPTFAPPVAPSHGTTRKPEFKLKKAGFGDGYSQTLRDGINHAREEATLSWDVLTEAQAATIYNWLKARGGDEAFYYTLRGDVQRRWQCEAVEKTHDPVFSVKATFKEDFNLSP